MRSSSALIIASFPARVRGVKLFPRYYIRRAGSHLSFTHRCQSSSMSLQYGASSSFSSGLVLGSSSRSSAIFLALDSLELWKRASRHGAHVCGGCGIAPGYLQRQISQHVCCKNVQARLPEALFAIQGRIFCLHNAIVILG